MNTRYELNMDVPPREAIRLMYVSKSRFGGDWNSVPHTHSCTEVFYCVDGRGQFNVEGKMLDVAPDDMVIVNPRTLHTELSYQACPLEYIVLGIEGVEILFNQRDQGYTMVKCGAMREDMLGLTKMLLREIDAREDGCEMVCQTGAQQGGADAQTGQQGNEHGCAEHCKHVLRTQNEQLGCAELLGIIDALRVIHFFCHE